MASNKAYESYAMLAKLINSNRSEDIDRAYDALSAALDVTYAEKKRQNEKSYSEKRDALARNKAKADKYLGYFMTEKGYSGSGVEADAKLKSELGYQAALSELYGSEAESEAKLGSDHAAELYKNEAGRAEKKAAAGKDYGELAYKAASDDADAELKKAKIESDEKVKLSQIEAEKVQKEKEYEIRLLQAKAEESKASAGTAAEKAAAAELEAQLNSYRRLLYEYVVSSFESTNDIGEMQRIYDSVTGANAENASKVYGEKLYSDMVKSFSKRLTQAKNEQHDAEVVQMLYDKFASAKNEYHYDTYLRLKRAAVSGAFPGYTVDQLDRAYKKYVNNG